MSIFNPSLNDLRMLPVGEEEQHEAERLARLCRSRRLAAKRVGETVVELGEYRPTGLEKYNDERIYLPTPSQIAKACAQIQRTWSARERRLRIVGEPDRPPHVEIPFVEIGHGGAE